MSDTRAKREWVYVMRPKEYEIAPCDCGNDDPDWSEFQGHLWCKACQKDFIPAHGGVFDGPIHVQGSELMGMRFDRLSLGDHPQITIDAEVYHMRVAAKDATIAQQAAELTRLTQACECGGTGEVLPDGPSDAPVTICESCPTGVAKLRAYYEQEIARLRGVEAHYERLCKQTSGDAGEIATLRAERNAIRKRVVSVYGGMGKGSAIWGNSPWDKGWTAGIQAALTAFDDAVRDAARACDGSLREQINAANLPYSRKDMETLRAERDAAVALISECEHALAAASQCEGLQSWGGGQSIERRLVNDTLEAIYVARAGELVPDTDIEMTTGQLAALQLKVAKPCEEEATGPEGEKDAI